jgi:hypothetical protein
MDQVKQQDSWPPRDGQVASPPSISLSVMSEHQSAHLPHSCSSASSVSTSMQEYTYGHVSNVGISSRRSRKLMIYEVMQTPEAATSSVTTSFSPDRKTPSSRELLVDVVATCVTSNLNRESRARPSSTRLDDKCTTIGNTIDIVGRGSGSLAKSNEKGGDEEVPNTTIASTRNEAFDVYPGNDHSKGGNTYFVKLIEKHLDDFEAANKENKRRQAIVDFIVDNIYQHGGRFLNERPSVHSRSIRKDSRAAKSTAANSESRCRRKHDTANNQNDSAVLTREATSKKVRDFFYRFVKKRRHSQLKYERSIGEQLSLTRKKRSIGNNIDTVTKKRPTVPTYRTGSRCSSRSKVIPRTTSTKMQDSSRTGVKNTANSASHYKESCWPRDTSNNVVAAFPQEDYVANAIQTACNNPAADMVVHSIMRSSFDGHSFNTNPIVDLSSAAQNDDWNSTPPHPPQRLVSASAGALKWFPFERDGGMTNDSPYTPRGANTGQSSGAIDWANDITGDDNHFSGLMLSLDHSYRHNVNARSLRGSNIRIHQNEDQKAIAMHTPNKKASANSPTPSNPPAMWKTTPVAILRSSLPRTTESNHQGSMGKVDHTGLPQDAFMSPSSTGMLSQVGSGIESEASTGQEALNLDLSTDNPGFSPIGWKIPTNSGGIINLSCYNGKMASMTVCSPTLGNFLSPCCDSDASVALEPAITMTGKADYHHTPQERSTPLPLEGPAVSNEVWCLSPQEVSNREYVKSGFSGDNVKVNQALDTRLTSTDRESVGDSSCVKNLTSQFAAQIVETSLSTTPFRVEPRHEKNSLDQSFSSF